MPEKLFKVAEYGRYKGQSEVMTPVVESPIPRQPHWPSPLMGLYSEYVADKAW